MNIIDNSILNHYQNEFYVWFANQLFLHEFDVKQINVFNFHHETSGPSDAKVGQAP